MKKRKILSLLLIITILTLSLSSCLGFNFDLDDDDDDDDSLLDGEINVQGGDNYDITIDSSATSDVLAASKALLSAVSVWCSFECYQYGAFGQVSGTTARTSAGAGVIYDINKNTGDAYVITNYHVVYDAASTAKNKISKDIILFLYGQEETSYAIPATYVGGSMQYDLALLRIDNSKVLMESNAVAAKFANSDEVAVLETAIAIGNPESKGISATVGHVNVDSEYITMLGSDNTTEVKLRVIRTDAAVNSGNSGGGLFNSKGELIGIVNAKMNDSSIDNIGYAIPSNVVLAVMKNIKDNCEGKDKECVYRCVLGVTVTAGRCYTLYDKETGKLLKMEEVVAEEVSKSGAANGIMKKGDVINSITIDGVTYGVTRIHHIIDYMLNARVGSTVVINVTRDGTTMNVQIQATESMFYDYT